MTKVLIFGTGGVGCIYGYILHKGGASVTTVCRTNYDAVAEHGITIRSEIFGRVHYAPVTVRSPEEARGPFDYVLVCSKAFPGTSALIKAGVGPETAIVLAQNGIGIEEEYASAYPNNTIITGVVYLPTTQVEPGIVEMGPLERFEIGTYPAHTSTASKARAERLAEIWTAGGATCKVFEDIQAQRWIKVSVNASWNPICALTLCDDANFLRSSSQAEDMVQKVMKEVGSVAVAAGYPVVTDKVIEEQLERPRRRLVTGGKEPSMLTDIRHGRPIEVEAIVGNTLRIASRYGVPTPYLELLYTLGKGLNFAVVQSAEWKPIAKFE